MTYQNYNNYKESGVEWMGAIPTHWEKTPIKRQVIQSNAGEVIDKSYWGGSSELLYTCAIEPLPCDYTNFPAIKRTTRSDLLLTRNGTPYVHKPKENSIYTNVVQRITLSDGINRDFLAIALQCSANNLKGYGVSIESLNYELWKELPIAIPLKEEQEKIVAFIDRETVKIDNLIAEQQRLIELLKEKRQAVITHAVTKGLDPNAPMKDSGVEWLGESPAHWKVTKVGRHLNILSGYAFPSNEFTTDDAHTRLLRGINVGVQTIRWDEVVYWQRKQGDNLERFELSSGDIVIGMDRPWIGDGTRIAILCDDDLPALLLQRVAKLTPDDQLNKKFLYYFLQSTEFYGYLIPDMTGVSVPHISPEQISSFLICLPPPSEQSLLVEFIEREISIIGDMTAISQSAIALLQERRSALISATVTGKIDVRNFSVGHESAS